MSNKILTIKTFFLSVLFFYSFALGAAQDLYLSGQQAEAYAQAKDFEQASDAYERLLKLELPDWQKAVLLYNLGTVKLKQQQYETAYNTFFKIPKKAVSSPWVLRDIERNEGLTFLYEALNTSQSENQETTDLLTQVQSSIHHFKVAEALDCLIERLEIDQAPLIPCGPPSLTVPLQAAHRLLNQIKQTLMQELAKKEKNALLLVLEGTDHLIDHLQTIPTKEYLPYFHYQAETLLPLWENIPQKLSKDLKQKYDEVLSHLDKGDVTSSIEALKSLKSQLEVNVGTHALDSLVLNYQLLLYTEPLSNNQLQSLLSAQKKIDTDDKQKLVFAQAEKYLTKSLSDNEKGQSALARFYLAAALSTIWESIETKQSNDPITILENALLAARNALQLGHLYSISPVNERDPEMDIILKNNQQDVLKHVPLFIAAVLKEEQERFAQSDQKLRCQKTPWNQAIPLFDSGAREAENGNTLLSLQPPHAESALEPQTLTVKYWKKVLDLLKSPPSAESNQPQPSETNPQPIPEKPSNANDVLRLIQEMQLQDQKEKWQMPAEFKSW